MIEQRCLFCGGDASEPDHYRHCDGRQGGIETPRHRDTAILAFYNSVASGVIDKRRLQVWVGLRALGPSTASEVVQYVKREYHVLADSRSFTPRFAQLRDDGLIREAGERICTVTGQRCVVWEVVPFEDYCTPQVVKHRCDTCGQLVRRTA